MMDTLLNMYINIVLLFIAAPLIYSHYIKTEKYGIGEIFIKINYSIDNVCENKKDRGVWNIKLYNETRLTMIYEDCDNNFTNSRICLIDLCTMRINKIQLYHAGIIMNLDYSAWLSIYEPMRCIAFNQIAINKRTVIYNIRCTFIYSSLYDSWNIYWMDDPNSLIMRQFIREHQYSLEIRHKQMGPRNYTDMNGMMNNYSGVSKYIHKIESTSTRIRGSRFKYFILLDEYYSRLTVRGHVFMKPTTNRLVRFYNSFT